MKIQGIEPEPPPVRGIKEDEGMVDGEKSVMTIIVKGVTAIVVYACVAVLAAGALGLLARPVVEMAIAGWMAWGAW